MENTNYTITKVTKQLTTHGNNCFEIEAVVATTGETIICTYFGNTTPKQLISVKQVGDYLIAEIQPHTSRDKKTGKFKCSRNAFA